MNNIKNFYPSNSSEGDYFYNLNCANCYKKSGCSIYNRSLIGIKPAQWIYDNENKPICTSLLKNKPVAKNSPKINQPKLF